MCVRRRYITVDQLRSGNSNRDRRSLSTDRSGVWIFALGAAVYGLPPLNGESTEPGITSLGAEVDSPGLAHPTARLSPPPPSFCNASTLDSAEEPHVLSVRRS